MSSPPTAGSTPDITPDITPVVDAVRDMLAAVRREPPDSQAINAICERLFDLLVGEKKDRRGFDAVWGSTERGPRECLRKLLINGVYKSWHWFWSNPGEAEDLLNETLADISPTGATPTAANPPTIWYHGGVAYSLDKVNQVTVSSRAIHHLLQAFLKQKRALTTIELAGVVTNVSDVVADLRKLYGGMFAGATRPPSKEMKGAGYDIRVRLAPVD